MSGEAGVAALEEALKAANSLKFINLADNNLPKESRYGISILKSALHEIGQSKPRLSCLSVELAGASIAASDIDILCAGLQLQLSRPKSPVGAL